MTIIEQEIVERLRRLDENQQEHVLAFIHMLETSASASETWTEDEIQEVLASIDKIAPKTGAEVVAILQSMTTTGWEHIEDGATWVAEQRRQQGGKKW
jgi:hypothetical protein